MPNAHIFKWRKYLKYFFNIRKFLPGLNVKLFQLQRILKRIYDPIFTINICLMFNACQ